MAEHVPNSPFHPPRKGTWPLQTTDLHNIHVVEDAFDLYEDLRDPFGTIRDYVGYPEAREFSPINHI